MCGIAGFISTSQRFPRDMLQRMADALAHRGPDDSGVELWARTEQGFAVAQNEGCVGLAHRRLSIMDLSSAGHQPMSNETGDLWITYNGEFYNFGDYRQELLKAGHRFRSSCDTETILHLYEEHKMEDVLRRMNGMFAFALWDSRKDLLILARDRAGQKPLYYMESNGKLLFASEIKALLATGLVDRQKLDFQALDQFWTLGYSTEGRTVFEQIRQLPAGCHAAWSNGALQIRRYWKCPFGSVPVRSDATNERLDELEALLADSIRLRLISDRPVGLFLSGGIDSGLIASVAARKLQQSLKTFTVSFSPGEYDEAPGAEAIARHLGLEHEVLRVDESMLEGFDGIARHFDEPFGDASGIPTWFLAKLARERVVVALTGDAGDELFGGYDEYRLGMSMWSGRGAIAGSSPFSLRSSLLKLAGPDRGYSLLQRHIGRRHRSRLYSSLLRREVSFSETYTVRARKMREIHGADVLSRMQYADFQTYLADDVLVKVDRMSMAHALECRSPLLDYRIIEFAAGLPLEDRIEESGRGKAILRRLLGRYVPERLYDRPKSGFTPPWIHWCAGAARAALAERWRAVAPPLFRAAAADWLIPLEGKANAVWLWQAFSMVNFLAERQEERREPRIITPAIK